MSQSGRRQFLLASGALVASPFMAHAQTQGKVWRIGYLAPRRRPASFDTDWIGDFLRGMRELGYVEGGNLVIEWRFADGTAERLPELAVELVRLKPDVIVSASGQAISALQKATTTIPIVMATSGDPLGSGFVRSMARPGGNITGLSNMFGDLGGKQLELLLGLAPKLSRVATLSNPVNPQQATILRDVQSAAQRVGVRVLPMEARTVREIERAFHSMTQEKAEAVIVFGDSLFLQQIGQIVELAMKNRLTSVSMFREFAEAGGLISYGPNLAEQFRRAATYVDKILKGAKPADLPIEQPTRLELVINLRTAKSLGITIPQPILLRADRVIE